MDDFLFYRRDEAELEEKLEKFVLFAQKKNLNVLPTKFLKAMRLSLAGAS